MFHALSRMSHRTHYLFASNLEPRKKYLHSLVRQLAPLYVYIMERTGLGLWWYQDHVNKNSVLADIFVPQLLQKFWLSWAFERVSITRSFS
jgi:hypothetical protein